MAKLEGEMHPEWEREPTTEERIAALKAELAEFKASVLESLCCHEQAIKGIEASGELDDIVKALDLITARLGALEAKPKGNKQGYPQDGVVWDGTRRNMAKAYGYTNADIETMQEAMDAHHIALKNTSKAKVSSDWQRNVQTWIINQARYDGRERQDGPGAPLADDVPDPSPEVLQALRDVLSLEPDELERDRKARLIWRAYPYPNTIMQACDRYRSPWWDQHHDKARMIRHARDFIEAKAAKLGIPAGAFAWPSL